jgi:RNA-directed DNA polymerase
MQAIVTTALEPEWESRFEANCYGFRPGRSCHDAIAALRTTLNHRGCSEWVPDADIRGCFDHPEYAALLKRLPVFTAVIRRWLKAGVVELGTVRATETGTLRGGTASPLLANILLGGLEGVFGCEGLDGRPVAPTRRPGNNRGVNVIRYADDFVVTAPSRAVLEEYVRSEVAALLANRGLALSEAKTRIVHVDERFHFLGVEVRRWRGTFPVRPDKAKVLAHLRRIKAYLRTHKQASAGHVIRALNPVIRGWASYYRHGSASGTFAHARHRVWAKRRHPHKPRQWVRGPYFADDGYWTFTDGVAQPYCHSATRITRFIKVIERSSPPDPV